MGYEERAWRDSPPSRGYPRFGGAVRTLLLANVGVFVLMLVLYLIQRPSPSGAFSSVLDALHLGPGAWVEHFPFVPLWQLVTYGFLHDPEDLLHILFNMLGLYFFGSMLEGTLGARRFYVLWFTALVVGALAQSVYQWSIGDPTGIVGASGAVMCCVVAAAVMAPNTPVIFFIFPMTLKVLALIMVGLDAFGVLMGGGNTAFLVHLGGEAFGFLAARRGWMYWDPKASWERRREQAVVEREQDQAARLDRLLAQIHEKGIHSLSAGDREFLKRTSQRR